MKAIVYPPISGSIFLGLAILCSGLASAHEFWLEPSSYNLSDEETLSVTLRNGENFSGEPLPYLPPEFKRYSLRDADGEFNVRSATGTLETPLDLPKTPGLKVLAYESVAYQLAYPSYEKFAQFTQEEGVEWVLEDYRSESSRPEEIRENYRRFAKSLVNVGAPGGADQPAGMELELVAASNPYLSGENDALRFQLLYQGKPLAGAQVSIFSRRQQQAVERSIALTNDKGMVTLLPLPGSEYLLNAVHIRRTGLLERFTSGTDWESLWASLTFSLDRP